MHVSRMLQEILAICEKNEDHPGCRAIAARIKAFDPDRGLTATQTQQTVRKVDSTGRIAVAAFLRRGGSYTMDVINPLEVRICSKHRQ